MKFRPALSFATGGLLSAAAIIGIRSCSDPQREYNAELDRTACYIIPNDRERAHEYEVEGKKIYVESVWYGGDHNRYPWRRLHIETKGTCFISENWGTEALGGPEGDARNLDMLKIRTETGWVSYSRDQIPNYSQWQKAYEGLIRKVANEKQRTDQNIPGIVKQKLNSLEELK